MHARSRIRSVVALAAVLLLVLSGTALSAVEFQQASTGMTNPNSGNAATSLSITKPVGLAEGDFMLAQVTYEKGSDAGTAASFTPAGWTLLDRRNESTDLGQAVFYRFATASDVAASSFSFSFSQAVKAAGAILRYTGVHTTAPIIDHSANSGQSGGLTALSVQAEADSVAVALFGVKKNTTLSLPAGMTSRVDFANPQDVKIRAADEARTAAGTTGNRTSTAGSSDKWVAHMVTLRKADPPPVTNHAPVYTAAADQTAETGVQKSFALGSFTDQDTHDSWGVTVNWGDGSTESTFTVITPGDLGTLAHTYTTSGQKTVTVTVSDRITTGSGTFKVDVTDPAPADTTPPTIAFDATGSYAPNGSNGWWNSGTAKVKVTATDPSGVSALACTLNGTAVALTNSGSNGTQRWGDVEMATDGVRTVSCGATDGATPANSTAAGDQATHTLRRDTTPPVVTVTGVLQGASYEVGSVPGAGCSTTDNGGSGVASPASLAAAPDNTVAGSKTVTCQGAVDNAGNAAGPVSVDYTVIPTSTPPPPVTYAAQFAKPLEASGVLNSTKLGRVVPVRVEVLGDDGSEDRTGPVSFQTRRVPCSTGAPIDNVDEVLAAGSSNSGNQFRWDASGDKWVFNLDTGKIGAKVGECHQLDVHRGGTVGANGAVSGGELIGSVRLTFTK